MAPVKHCPDCNYTMRVDAEEEQAMGTYVTYVCQNRICPTYVSSGGRYPQKVKEFVGKR